MRYSTYINNQKCLDWGLNANQGALFDLLNQSVSWASEVVIEGVVYYWVSRHKVIEELPLFYKTADTVYRHFVELNDKGLIVYLKQGKHGDKDLIRLTDKGKTWNEFKSDLSRDNSEINPSLPNELGNESEITRKQIRDNSEINPTDKYINNKNTKDHIKKTSQKKTALLDFELHFEKFWSAGMRKVGKEQALKKFKSVYESYNAEYPTSLEDFTQMLIDDVAKRLRLKQFGFDNLHPSTYLNNWRWLDDYPQEPAGQNMGKIQSDDEFADNGTWGVGRKLNIDPSLIPEYLR
ncbi:hypothetical protein MUU45_001152 [Rodentibacter pneumotropicus]|uniref:Uncharacterized protein n=1 Tax=Rodentibacter pneumotropicus TaxID=758 RepID=A0AAW5LDU1_9PAST|nr:hypothetical protein [Rodentibacter pneumotropicus]MCQ9121602.1 hypothetical protein [Rodentibacter pneumotropicus]